MASHLKSFFTFLFLLIFHLGCFIFTTTNHSPTPNSNKKRKVTPSSPFSTTTTATTCSSPSRPSSSRPKSKPHKALSSSWSFFKKIFIFKSPNNKTTKSENPTPISSSARSSHRSIPVLTHPSDLATLSPPSRKRRNGGGSCSDLPDISLDHRSFPLRNDIFPCPTCGEIFPKPQLVEQHQSMKHAVTELYDGDSGNNVVRIIFKTGWNNNRDNNNNKNPIIHQILKIHNSPKILRRFEEYRELVKSKEARTSVRRRDERCVADGNELLRFHCSTFICNLGHKGNSSICTQQYCSVCGIIRSGFSAKMDGISTMSSSWRAHVALPEELEEEFKFMNVKRAMLVCRVVAGRIGTDQVMVVGKEESCCGAAGFDSVIGRGGSVVTSGVVGGSHLVRLDEDELVVFNPRAVLPCFAIIYSV